MRTKLTGLFSAQSGVPDEFIKRIRSLVIGEGMLREGNIELMETAISSMPAAGSVIEIGSYGGLSANLIIYLLMKHRKTNPFFTCDAWIYEGYNDHKLQSPEAHIDGRTDVSRANYSEYMQTAFINATRFLSAERLPFSFRMFSDQFFERWNAADTAVDIFGQRATFGGAISFAYIDGGHSREVAWNDFTNVAAHLLPGGFILLDDSGDGQNFGSAQMMSEIKKDKRFEIVAKKPNYLIRKIG